jgi:hypothetical protein
MRLVPQFFAQCGTQPLHENTTAPFFAKLAAVK